MAGLSTRHVISSLLLGLAVIMFVPAFADAAAGFEYGSWRYGPQVATVLDNTPIILVCIALIVLVKPLDRVGE